MIIVSLHSFFFSLSSRTPEPTSTATSTEEPQPLEQDLTAGAILAVTSIFAFLGLLVYLIKRK